MDSRRIRTRRTAEIGASPILDAASLAERSSVAFGLDLFWTDGRSLDSEFLGTSTGEIAFNTLFQHRGGTPPHNTQLTGVGGDARCCSQLRSQAGAPVPCRNSRVGRHGSALAVGYDSFPDLLCTPVV